MNEFRFSKHGILDKDLFCMLNIDFIGWCKANFKSGTFSTYIGGEPVFICCGMEVSLSTYQKNIKTGVSEGRAKKL